MRLLFPTLATSLVMAVFFVHAAFAHAGEPRLEINVDRILPGGIVDVRGVGFDYEDAVTLTLIGPQGELALGEVTADTEGVFIHIVTLPTDLAEGTYYFRGVTTHHYTLSPALTVQGNAIPAEGEGEEERWEEEDQLPFAIPTYPPGVVPGVASTPAPIAAAPVDASPVSSGLSTNILILAGLMVVVAVLMFGFMRKKNTQ
jgi:hypothetical protein